MEQISQFLNVEEIATSAVAFVPRFLVAIVILFVFWLSFRLTNGPLSALMRRSGLEPVLVTLLVDKIYRFALLVFGLVMAAGQVGINVGAALAGIGVVGIAVGFAAQDMLANVISGFVIFWDKPFGVGDFITVNDQYGAVTNVTLRSTRIRTNRNTYVVIPNRRIVDDVLVNHSKHGETRLDIPVGIAYKENIPEARDVILAAVTGLEGVADKPAPSVVVDGLGDSSVNLLVRVWIDEAREEQPVFFRVVEASKLALDAAGIQIPFPHLQLFVDDVEERVLTKAATVPRLAAQERG
jgi:small conductance mechanosensitive channel